METQVRLLRRKVIEGRQGVTIRILADREPYSGFADFHGETEGSNPETLATVTSGLVVSAPGSLPGSFVILNGPPELDDPPPDILVMPAEDFLALRARPLTEPVKRTLYIPFGPVALMEKSFEQGCVDYIREPWSLPELRSRARRFLSLRFRAAERTIEMKGSTIVGEKASIELSECEGALLRLLVLNAPFPIPKEATISLLPRPACKETYSLSRCVSSLRRKMESAEPGLGARLLAIRGFGYRLDVSSCG